MIKTKEDLLKKTKSELAEMTNFEGTKEEMVDDIMKKEAKKAESEIMNLHEKENGREVDKADPEGGKMEEIRKTCVLKKQPFTLIEIDKNKEGQIMGRIINERRQWISPMTNVKELTRMINKLNAKAIRGISIAERNKYVDDLGIEELISV